MPLLITCGGHECEIRELNHYASADRIAIVPTTGIILSRTVELLRVVQVGSGVVTYLWALCRNYSNDPGKVSIVWIPPGQSFYFKSSEAIQYYLIWNEVVVAVEGSKHIFSAPPDQVAIICITEAFNVLV